MCPRASCCPDTVIPGREASRRPFGLCASLLRRTFTPDADRRRASGASWPTRGVHHFGSRGGRSRMGSEKAKMLTGELYRASDPELVRDRRRCRSVLRAFNAQEDEEQRLALLKQLLGGVGDGAFIQPPFACDYGYNLFIGDGVFVNFNTVILDCAEVRIGDGTQLGPGVQLLAADHPRAPQDRRSLLELARPVSIGSNVWLGAAAIVLPGISVGDDSIIGAGSVVTRDIPSGVMAVGAPCRVVSTL